MGLRQHWCGPGAPQPAHPAAPPACHAPQELKRRSPKLLISVSPYRDTWRAIYRPLLTGKYGRHVDTVLFQAYAYQDVSRGRWGYGWRGWGQQAPCWTASRCVHVAQLACMHARQLA